jgi:hypothetical protein
LFISIFIKIKIKFLFFRIVTKRIIQEMGCVRISLVSLFK